MPSLLTSGGTRSPQFTLLCSGQPKLLAMTSGGRSAGTQTRKRHSRGSSIPFSIIFDAPGEVQRGTIWDELLASVILLGQSLRMSNVARARSAIRLSRFAWSSCAEKPPSGVRGTVAGECLHSLVFCSVPQRLGPTIAGHRSAFSTALTDLENQRCRQWMVPLLPTRCREAPCSQGSEARRSRKYCSCMAALLHMCGKTKTGWPMTSCRAIISSWHPCPTQRMVGSPSKPLFSERFVRVSR